MLKFSFIHATLYMKTTGLFVLEGRRHGMFLKQWVLGEVSDAANSFWLHCIGHLKGTPLSSSQSSESQSLSILQVQDQRHSCTESLSHKKQSSMILNEDEQNVYNNVLFFKIKELLPDMKRFVTLAL